MDSGDWDRGVSEVVGFILVFGMLVIAFTVYQGIVVPDQNRQVEFQHNQEVHGQLQDLRNAIVTTAATGSGQAVSVTLGASYPRRALAQNLGVSGGAIQTTDAGGGDIRIDNARAIDGESADYLDGTPRRFETVSIRYAPVYTFYSSAPETVYENSLLYNQFGGANVTLTDQVIVDGRRITLIAVDGNLTRAERDTVSISTKAISASSNRVAVENTTGERINVTIPTRLSAAKWTEILADEIGSGGYVEGVHDVPGGGAVNLSMQPGVTYELRMAKVGVGGATIEESAKYVVAVEGDETSVAEGGTNQLIVDVRDRFNNPVSNVTVDASVFLSAGTGDDVSPSRATTDTEGRATFTYVAPGDVDGAEDADVVASFGGGDANETVTFDVEVLDSDGSGSTGGGGGTGNGGGGVQQINPGATGSITLESISSFDGLSQSVTLTFRNTTNQEIKIAEARISFFYDAFSSPSGPSEATIYSDGQGIPVASGTTLDFGENFVSLSPNPIPLNPTPSDSADTTVVNLAFDEPITDNDFYVISLKFGNGETYTYFVSHP